MTPEDERTETDGELHRILQSWTAPVVPEGMDERILAAHRGRRARPWWRFFTASVRVPLPVAVALVLLLTVLTAVVVMRPAVPAPAASSPEVTGPVQAARGTEPSLVTRTSLAGFQPESELHATVVTEGGP
jgi:hypothetical protein